MNKQLFDSLVETEKNVSDQLDPESKRYLDRSILERKLDGIIRRIYIYLIKEIINNKKC